MVNIKQGLVTADVTLELDGGVRVVASITFESAETLGLQVGMPATAIFEAASVMLGARKD